MSEPRSMTDPVKIHMAKYPPLLRRYSLYAMCGAIKPTKAITPVTLTTPATISVPRQSKITLRTVRSEPQHSGMVAAHGQDHGLPAHAQGKKTP